MSSANDDNRSGRLAGMYHSPSDAAVASPRFL